MTIRRETGRLRTTGSLCKPPPRPLHAAVCLASAAVLIGLGAGCATTPPPRTITVAELENAPPQTTLSIHRAVIGDATALQECCIPLGPRLSLLQVRDPAQWRRLARILRLAGPCPDFGRGMLIGIVSWAGVPIDGSWPVHLDSVQVTDGGGLVNATFAAGSYLPDGTGYAETAYVDGLYAVLVVDVNGTSFYPE